MENDTGGTLKLEIARIERQLGLFREQLALSILYPDHHKKLKECVIQVQARLEALIQRQQQLGLENQRETKC